jgi:hypothetical protein
LVVLPLLLVLLPVGVVRFRLAFFFSGLFLPSPPRRRSVTLLFFVLNKEEEVSLRS